ncbi:ABC-F type ribosomal protection protein [Clostridium sporogenes]|uniref:ABC-F type ribosomal protection protein n=1 Tax=Clostridium botulinum TaxID=1491 RepID=A0A6M0SVT2_CLOBO|nr:ABC-F type ribosomal protection protein CplR [Clostridium sporogenes]NFA59638.1 ABC-F type ribosomal protection protein [Clostridium botulinum]NFI73348.1 ABC-F type ribosomal protection protein [Clostridium sporogenes]NFL72641.1 ABC-F type ribosomal protection protein [Clostridium sporogenes]NFM23207.1 ABC-F type ribosomal protection protein [Clostridium sporogenes]NFP61404.1 ABC-F type ribosomal protection protein [Clostridium sporogenes]
MVLIKLDKVKKYYEDKLILDIDNLEIKENSRIGIVGENGAGKTTLIKVILGELDIDEGKVFFHANYSYISQSENYAGSCADSKIKSILGAPDNYNEFLSGGEKVKISINQALSSNSNFLIADEPTANLDTNTIKSIEKLINEYKGGLLLVSHDRDFLNNLCDNILEIENGKVKLYKCGYSKYLKLKTEEREVEKKEYEEYITEKKRLEKSMMVKENQRNSIKKAPKRMGNSEARLHKMGDQKSKKHLDGNIKSLKSRINHLEVKKKPTSSKNIKIKITEGNKMPSKTVIEVKNLNLYIGNKLLIKNGNFKIKNGKKAAIIGKNGCGKTTLIKEILKRDTENIRLSKYISIGYFDQDQDILDKDKKILDNIKSTSSYDESFMRIHLAGFGFKGDTIYKSVSILSGGEKVKVALCKIILSDTNTLILDEPTNYLDIKSIESLEKALINTDKTIVMISHDRSFISSICDYIIEIKDTKLNCFSGTYADFTEEKTNYETKKQENSREHERKEKLFILENRLSRIISEISLEKDLTIKEKLNEEYTNLLKEIKALKK